MEIKGAEKVDELKDKEIKDALDANLAKKGLTKTDAATADLYIGYQCGVLTEKQFASYSDWEYGPGWYREGWHISFHLTYARFSELSSNHRTDLNVGRHHGGYPQ